MAGTPKALTPREHLRHHDTRYDSLIPLQEYSWRLLWNMAATHKAQLRIRYFVARLTAALLICIFSYILPPFDTSHLIAQPKPGLASALLRWDAFHFSSIALSGYQHEQRFAFFPGVPLLSRFFGEVGLRAFRLIGLCDRVLVQESDVLIGGASAAFLLCDWTADLYE